VILGKTEPRLSTPPLPENCDATGELLPYRTHGYAAIAFAEKMLHMRLFPWQRWLLVHALELVPNPNGPGDLYRFRTVIVMVARQNGKTTVEVILALWHIYALESGTVIGTAQDLANAERAWRDAVALAENDDELSELIPDDGIYLGHPKVFTLDNGCEYRIAAATRRGARGFPGDLILLDELREHQNWDSWASVTNTMNARPKAQAWAFSNAGDALSIVLRYLRALAHKEMGWPDGDDDAELLGGDNDSTLDMFDGMDPDELPEGWDELTTGFFEWSAPPTAKRTEMEALSWANPSLNHTETSEMCPTTRTLVGKMRSDPPLIFDMEVMCRFVPMAEGGPFIEGSWAATESSVARPADSADRVMCVEVSARRDQTYIARAALMPDGRAVLGIAEDRPGTDWVRDYLATHQDSCKAIVIRTETGSPTLTLFDNLMEDDDADLVDLIVEWKGADVATANGDMFDRLRDKTIEHLPHKGLDMAATSAVPIPQPTGGFRIDIRKSPTDTASLLAGIGAVWGLEHLPDNVSVYAEDEVLIVQ
jgi:hypothetical protein